MPSFKEDSIIIIAPGSHTTLAQLGLPESFTPARHRFKSRMFPAETPGEWEPHRIRKKTRLATSNGAAHSTEPATVEPEYEEDLESDEGAVWPITSGRITDWDCFFALMEYVHAQINPPWHTPILLIAQPAWTPKEHEKMTSFFFEKFKCPGLALVDAAVASCYAFGLETACVVDVGADKADITAIREFVPSSIGRGIAVENCGGEALTQRLLELLAPKQFSRDMCEQLKKSTICEILPSGTPFPGSQTSQGGSTKQSTTAAPSVTTTSAAAPAAPAGTAPVQNQTSQTETPNGEAAKDETKDLEDNDGVLDVASLVTGGKMNEFLAKKEKEKQEKQEKVNSRKKGNEAGATQQKQARLKNSEKEKSSFYYEDFASLESLRSSGMNSNGVLQAKPVSDETSPTTQTSVLEPRSPNATTNTSSHPQRREIVVGIERFQAATGSMLTLLSNAIYRTIHSHPDPTGRSDLWNNIVLVGRGAAIRGFREALISTLNSRFLISPSSATMFTSELPSNFSTPAGTGSQTPIGHGHTTHSSVNPLLHAATTAAASGAGLAPPQLQTQHTNSHSHSSHAQAPTSIKFATLPEYFPEWKDVGSEEAAFLGAQVAARVLYVVNTGTGSDKGYMSRPEYNENGPSGIHDYSMTVA